MKQYIDVFIINISAIIISLAIYFINGQKPELALSIIAAGISISFGIRQYKIENDKMFKELFSAFNQKYDEKFNDYLNDIDSKVQQQEAYVLTATERKIIVDYLNLCAEEFLWYKKKRIDEAVWLSWENGMLYYLKIKPIKDIVESEKKQKDSYYGLFDKLKI